MKAKKIMNKIVVILEDERSVADVLQMIAKKHGFAPICFMYVDNLIEHIDLLKKTDLFITDYNLYDSTVISVLQEIKIRNINVYTVLNSSNPNAIKDIEKSGLSEYINEQIDKTTDFNTFFRKFNKD